MQARDIFTVEEIPTIKQSKERILVRPSHNRDETSGRLFSSLRGGVFSWALYDWANSAYATVVLAGFFPILYHDFWATGNSEQQTTFEIGLANSLCGVLLLLLGPLLGSFADHRGLAKKMLIIFACLGALTTLALGFFSFSSGIFALSLFIIATSAFLLSNVFYDAMLMEVGERTTRERISSYGYAFGYLGGGILLLALAVVVVNHQWFGFSSSFSAMRFGFVVTAIWWLVFSLPLFLRRAKTPPRRFAASGWKHFKQMCSLVISTPELAWFLVAYWLYIDGVGAIIIMAVNYGQVLGFSANDLISALLLVQFIGFPATLAYGFLAERYGAKRAVLSAIAAYVVISAWAAVMKSYVDFYLLAAAIGVFQGSVQAQSRSLFTYLVPMERKSQLFGVYNLVGKFATIIGPILIAYVGIVTGSPRLGILSISLLFIVGGMLLFWKIPNFRQETKEFIS